MQKKSFLVYETSIVAQSLKSLLSCSSKLIFASYAKRLNFDLKLP